MEPIRVPKPNSKRDPDRPVSSLLLAQVHHLREAEKSLPPKYHSGIFSHAIQTEGEAARYIRSVTEAIHKAHRDASSERLRRKKERGVITIAAGVDETGGKKAPGSKGKKGGSRRKT